MATIPPFIWSIFNEAEKLWPNRSEASDGAIGDASHQATTNDHNPDSRGIVHAIDLTHDPAHGFDAWQWAQILASRCAVGDEQRIKYIVAFNPFFGVLRRGHDVVASPKSGWKFVRNGSGSAHKSHLHISIKYEQWVENSRAPLFNPVLLSDQEEEMPKPTDLMGAVCTPHGMWQVTYDGGVRTIAGQFYGSYLSLKPAQRQGTRGFVDITARPDGKPGYVLHATDYNRYQFGAETI